MKNSISTNQQKPPHGDLETLRVLHAAHPEDMTIAANLAQLYADKGWLNEAIELYKTVVDHDDTNYPLLLEYGNICFKKEELDESLRVFQKLTVLKPQRVEGWNNLGIVQHARGDNKAALESFEKVLELEPDNAGALLNAGNCHAAQGMHEKALAFFTKAVAVRLDFADGWFNLGNAYCALHDYKKAIDAFEKAIRYQREFPSALKNMGFAYEQMGDMDNALTRYLQALELSKGDAGLYVNIANAYVAWKNYDEAKTYYLQSVKLSPKEIAGWMGLRHIALLKGDIDSYAKSTMAVVSRLSPETVAESLMVLREVNHWSEADELLCKADSMDATSDELDAERLLAYQRTDSYPGKIIALVKRLKSLPSPSDHTLSCLARYAFDIKDFAAAQGYLEKVKTPSIRAMRLLWQTSIAQKEWDKTQKLILPYLEDNDNRSDALFFLAKIKAANHDLNAAREFLIKALEAGFSELELLEGDPGLKKVFEELRAKKGTE